MKNQKNPKPDLLAITTRGNTIENLHYGWICVINKDKKIIYKKGNIFDSIFLRSALKPIQALPVIDNKIEATQNELALICASHSGSKKHLKVLSNFMKKHKIKLTDLQCGTHLPFDENEKNNLLRKKLSPTSLHNNCSGKHLGMLSVCKKNKWDLTSYLSHHHPIQKIILNKIKELSEAENISIAIDGCSAPTFALPIINIAKMFSNFTYCKNKTYLKIFNAMTKYPFYVGGKNHIDSEIMRITKGRFIAKAGAEGIIIIAGSGNSAVIKIADGSGRIRSVVALKLLHKLKWLKMGGIIEDKIKNHAGKTIGKIIPLIDF